MLDLEHQLQGRFSDLAIYKTGSIVIGISAHRSVALMPPVVSAFKSLYPGVILRIVEKERTDLLEAAGYGGFALVATALPVDRDYFTYETFFIEENVVAMKESIQAEETEGKRVSCHISFLTQSSLFRYDERRPLDTEGT